MKLKLKICGMKEAANIEAVAALRPDYMGFIFYPRSPRYVGPSFRLAHPMGNTKPVGVFVNETTEAIRKSLPLIGSTTVQLHGNESVDQCKVLKAYGISVIKVFSIDAAFDFQATAPYEGVVDAFLFDTKGKLPGGNAVVFDWSKLEEYNQKVPFFLSGGLNLENLAEVQSIMNMNLLGLDFNSGVEDEPGIKNIEKIRRVKEIMDLTT